MARRHLLPIAVLPLMASCFHTLGGRGNGGGCTGCRNSDLPGCTIATIGGKQGGSGDDPDAAPPPGTSVGLGVVAQSKGFSLDEIRDVVERNQGGIRACYDRQIRERPGVGGVVVVGLTIDPWGSVVGAAAHGVHVELEACMVTLFKRIVFPRPATGAAVNLELPFTLTLSR